MLSLYKVPGLFVCGFVGKFGSGKTLSMLEQGILLLDKFKLNYFVANFSINLKEFRSYCLRYGFNHAAYARIVSDVDIENLLKYNNAIILLDEAGLELFSRDWKANAFIFDDLFQIRKKGSILFYSAQQNGQIDKQLRQITSNWVYCRSFSLFDLKLRRSKMVSRFQILFDDVQWDEFLLSQRRNKMFYPIFLSGFRFSWQGVFISRVFLFIRFFWGLIKSIPFFLVVAFKKGGFFWFPVQFLMQVESYIKTFDFRLNIDHLFKVYSSFKQVKDGRKDNLFISNGKKKASKHIRVTFL